MAKTKKLSPTKNIIVGICCLIVGLVIGFIGNIIFSLPESYKIPDVVSGSKYVPSGLINNSVINSSDLSIHFLELGNKNTGDCIFIQVGNTQILVDGGSKTSSIPYITDYVDKQMGEDKHLDYIIITHAHEDHYAGFATNKKTESLFDHYRDENTGRSIGTIITFAETNKSPSKGMHANYEREIGEAIVSGAKNYTALECYENAKDGAQRTYALGNNVYLRILFQKYYLRENKPFNSTENNFSVCFEIVQENKNYLFTGDLEKEGEASLIAENHLEKVELYKAGHHGSKTSSSKELMNIIQPKIVVVTCVAGSSEYTSKNENQFPTQEFINNVYSLPNTPQVYVTSLCLNYNENRFESFNGTIVVCTSNEQTSSTVYCSNNTTILKDTDWFKNNRTLPSNAVA